jgi:hypothetical protein
LTFFISFDILSLGDMNMKTTTFTVYTNSSPTPSNMASEKSAQWRRSQFQVIEGGASQFSEKTYVAMVDEGVMISGKESPLFSKVMKSLEEQGYDTLVLVHQIAA